MQYENRYHEVDKSMSQAIKPTFKITQNRKAWNQAAIQLSYNRTTTRLYFAQNHTTA